MQRKKKKTWRHTRTLMMTLSLQKKNHDETNPTKLEKVTNDDHREPYVPLNTS